LQYECELFAFQLAAVGEHFSPREIAGLVPTVGFHGMVSGFPAGFDAAEGTPGAAASLGIGEERPQPRCGMTVDAAFGPLSAHMLQHILLTNLLAPAVAVGLRGAIPASLGRGWPAAVALQIGLLWAWHAPPAVAVALSQPAAMVAMHASLTAAALWFWSAVVATSGHRRWRAIVALAVTAKLFCLLGALFVFAARPLYGGIALADQQLAGLAMLAACPAGYVVAGVVVAARWLRDLDRADAGRGGPPAEAAARSVRDRACAWR